MEALWLIFGLMYFGFAFAVGLSAKYLDRSGGAWFLTAVIFSPPLVAACLLFSTSNEPLSSENYDADKRRPTLPPQPDEPRPRFPAQPNAPQPGDAEIAERMKGLLTKR
jgi:hypothetical protein